MITEETNYEENCCQKFEDGHDQWSLRRQIIKKTYVKMDMITEETGYQVKLGGRFLRTL